MGLCFILAFCLLWQPSIKWLELVAEKDKRTRDHLHYNPFFFSRAFLPLFYWQGFVFFYLSFHDPNGEEFIRMELRMPA